MIETRIEGIDAVVDRLQTAAIRIDAEVGAAMRAETEMLVDAVKERMAALFTHPDKMQSSVPSAVTPSSASLVATVFASGLPYLAIQEYGGVTRPHDIFPVRAKALAFAGGGGTVFARHVHHPGSRLPARPYMRSALDQRRAAIFARLRDVVSAIANEA